MEFELSHLKICTSLIEKNKMVECYRDGLVLYNKDGIMIGVVKAFEDAKAKDGMKEKKGEKCIKYKMFTNRLVLPGYVLNEIIAFIGECYRVQAGVKRVSINSLMVADGHQASKEKEKGIYTSNWLWKLVHDNLFYFTYERNNVSSLELEAELRLMYREKEGSDIRPNLLRIANSEERQILNVQGGFPEVVPFITQRNFQTEGLEK